MKLPIYQVDAFTDQLFGGNPAAVVPLKEWLSAPEMQKIAAENNLAETAFFIPQGENFEYTRIRDRLMWPCYFSHCTPLIYRIGVQE